MSREVSCTSWGGSVRAYLADEDAGTARRCRKRPGLIDKYYEDHDFVSNAFLHLCETRLELLRQEGYKHPLVEWNAPGVSVRYFHTDDEALAGKDALFRPQSKTFYDMK